MHFPSLLTQVGSALEGLITSFIPMDGYLIPLFSLRTGELLITVAPKKTPSRFRSPIRTRSQTRMKNQEGHQATASAAEFNEMKNELRNLIHLMAMMMADLKIKLVHRSHRIQDLPKASHKMKCPMFKLRAMPILSVQINILQVSPP